MARRSRDNKQHIPGYDESRPTRDDRKLQHRANRHATHQMLHALDDPDDVVLPEERRDRLHESPNGGQETGRRRFKIWKTKFWKRRDAFKDQKAEIDADWPVITPDQLRQE